MENIESILLLGNYRPTVALARQLDAAGYSVIVTREDGGLAAVSRHVSEIWEHRYDLASDAFVTELAGFLQSRQDIRIVVPVQESCVLAVARNRDILGEDTIFVTPRPDIVEACLDKVRMLELVERNGVPSAPAFVVHDHKMLLQAAKNIGSPLIVRPASSSQPIMGRKALIVKTADDIAAIIPEWPEGHDVLIVQRFVDGPRYNIDFVAEDGRIVRAVATKVLRTNASDGTGIDVSGITVPMPDDLLDYTERLAGTLNYTGVGLAQFMVDRDGGEITFLELNPRYNGNHGVTEKAGLGVGQLSVKIAKGHRKTERVIALGGDRHAWVYGDMLGVFQSWYRGMLPMTAIPTALFHALRDGLTADHHIMWSWSDPKPGLSQFAIPFRKIIRKIAGRRSKALVEQIGPSPPEHDESVAPRMQW